MGKSMTRVRISSFGAIVFIDENSMVSRAHGPAIILSNGEVEYWIDGLAMCERSRSFVLPNDNTHLYLLANQLVWGLR
jgi:hypothetical protein